MESNLDKYFKEKRKDFLVLNQNINGHKLVYLDSAATALKPKILIDGIVDFYSNYTANVHRGSHFLSMKASDNYEAVRNKVSNFINAKSEKEIVFLKNASEALNLVAKSFEKKLKKNDEILLTHMEHHANLVPWQELAKKTGAKLRFIPFNDNYQIEVDTFKSLINDNTKILAINHASNVLGTINDIETFSNIAKKKNIIVVVDASQSIAHQKIDVQKLSCDFLAFSAHKICGPSGVGILWAKYNYLNEMEPIIFGGDMIYEVGLFSSTYNIAPYKFEAGTPNIEGVIGLGFAIDYLNEIGFDKIEKYEKELIEYFFKKSSEIKDLKIYGSLDSKNRLALFSFNIKGIHSHDLSDILDKYGIAVRGGHHCAMPLMGILNIPASCRASFYFYNTKEEIDYLIEILKKVKKIYESGVFLKSDNL